MDDTALPLQDDYKAAKESRASLSSWVSRLFKGTPTGTVETSHSKASEKMMIAAERFHVLRVEDVMVPRADIVAVDVTTGLMIYRWPSKMPDIRACLFIKTALMIPLAWYTSKTCWVISCLMRVGVAARPIRIARFCQT